MRLGQGKETGLKGRKCWTRGAFFPNRGAHVDPHAPTIPRLRTSSSRQIFDSRSFTNVCSSLPQNSPLSLIFKQAAHLLPRLRPSILLLRQAAHLFPRTDPPTAELGHAFLPRQAAHLYPRNTPLSFYLQAVFALPS
jgi:hypothetical protein